MALLGFGANLALLTSLGAQHTFLIRQGPAHRHVGLVVGICIVSDALLISSGITGMSQILTTHLWVPTALAITAITWLNAHVLLETGLVLGAAATSCGPGNKWWFGAGAITASAVWFLAAGFGIGVLRPASTRPITWQVLDGATALMMPAPATTVLLTAL